MCAFSHKNNRKRTHLERDREKRASREINKIERSLNDWRRSHALTFTSGELSGPVGVNEALGTVTARGLGPAGRPHKNGAADALLRGRSQHPQKVDRNTEEVTVVEFFCCTLCDTNVKCNIGRTLNSCSLKKHPARHGSSTRKCPAAEYLRSRRKKAKGHIVHLIGSRGSARRQANGSPR